MSDTSPQVALLRMIYGAVTARLLGTAAELGIADLVSESPRSVTDLAAATETETDALQRILRTLASVGVFTETAPGTFGQTEMSAPLRTGTVGSIRDADPELGSAETFGALEHITHSVRTGEPAFDQRYGTRVVELPRRAT